MGEGPAVEPIVPTLGMGEACNAEAITLFQYRPTTAEHLAFEKDETITVLEQQVSVSRLVNNYYFHLLTHNLPYNNSLYKGKLVVRRVKVWKCGMVPELVRSTERAGERHRGGVLPIGRTQRVLRGTLLLRTRGGWRLELQPGRSGVGDQEGGRLVDGRDWRQNRHFPVKLRREVRRTTGEIHSQKGKLIIFEIFC